MTIATRVPKKIRRSDLVRFLSEFGFDANDLAEMTIRGSGVYAEVLLPYDSRRVGRSTQAIYIPIKEDGEV